MPERCNRRTTLPRSCLEAFSRITEQLGGISAKVDAIHQQVTRTNGQVAALFERTSRHETGIQLLQAGAATAERGRVKWGRRIWQAVVGAALLALGWLLGA